VRSSGIHNFLTSSAPFTPFEKHFLSNGLRFICTPPTSSLPKAQEAYFDDSTRGWLRFDRSITNRVLHEPAGNRPAPYLPKFAVKSARSLAAVDHMEATRRATHSAPDLQLLEGYRRNTFALLHGAAATECQRAFVQQHRRNHSATDTEFLRRLMNDASITIKPADKNLGLALVDTSWYNAELHRMLSDQVTYRLMRRSHLVKGKQEPLTPAILQATLLAELEKLVQAHESCLKRCYPHLADTLLKYLRTAVNTATCKLPGIYLLIKVHKASGLCGRPIVPSTSWLTAPASVVVDHLLQDIVRKANITHLVKDTKSFVVELESTCTTTRDGVFVTADIASLYTNIDTELGLRLVRRFLHEQEVAESQSQLICALLTFVMHNSWLHFRGAIYEQIDGTAMGTACAPVYANIVVYMLEIDLVRDMAAVLHLYRRFLDDVFAYLERSAVAEFTARMNALHPKLRFDFVSHPDEAAFLDLRIHKGRRFADSAVFDLVVHQKKMNLYLYIPFHSFHTDAMKRSFIQTELMRYIRNSSDREDYAQLKRTFFQRLRDRGYPQSFLLPLFASISYADRHYFLYPAASLHEHPLLLTRPPLSACLQRRLARWKLRQPAPGPATADPSDPPVFIIPYSLLSSRLPTRSLLSHHWARLQDAMSKPTPPPIIAYQSGQSLLKLLVYTRDSLFEKTRVAQAQLITPAQSLPSTQRTITDFTVRMHSAAAAHSPLDPLD